MIHIKFEFTKHQKQCETFLSSKESCRDARKGKKKLFTTSKRWLMEISQLKIIHIFYNWHKMWKEFPAIIWRWVTSCIIDNNLRLTVILYNLIYPHSNYTNVLKWLDLFERVGLGLMYIHSCSLVPWNG